MFTLIISLISTFIITFPFFHHGFISGHDVAPHLFKSQLMFSALKAGQFPVRWIEGVLSAQNLPHFQFYPPLFAFLTAIPQFFGFHYTVATYLILFLATLLGFWSIYLFIRHHLGVLPALVAALVFSFSPYHFSLLYVRGAFSEYLAISLIPLAFLAISMFPSPNLGEGLRVRSFLCHRVTVSPILLSVILTLVTLSHQPTLLIFAFPLLLWTIFNYLRFVGAQRAAPSQSRQFFFSLSLSLLLYLLLSAFFLLPLYFEQQFIQASSLTSNYYNFVQHFASFYQLLYSKWGFGVSVSGQNDGMSFQLGLVNWFIVFIAAISPTLPYFFSVKLSQTIKQYLIIAFSIFIFSLLMCLPFSLPIWLRFPLLSYIQYPWRFLSLAIFSVSLLSGILISVFFPSPNLGEGLRVRSVLWHRACPPTYAVCGVVTVALCLLLLTLTSLPFLRPTSYFDKNRFTIGRLSLEDLKNSPDPMFGLEVGYLPRDVKFLETITSTQAGEIISGSGNLKTLTNDPHRKTILVDLKTPATIRFFTHNFPNWTATRKTLITTYPFEVKTQEKSGFILLEAPAGESEITLTLSKTPLRAISDGLSLTTSLGIFLYVLYRRFS